MIDFHTHVFPPIFRENRRDLSQKEPAFAKLYSSIGAKMAGAEQLLEHMEKEEIQHSVVFGFPWRSEELFKQHNDYVGEILARYPDKFSAFCCFHPLAHGAAREAERCLRSGFSGIGELGIYHKGLSRETIRAMGDVMAVARDFRVPVMIHVNEPVGHKYLGKAPLSLKQIFSFVQAYPDNRIILAHWGGGLFFYALLRKEIKEAISRVWFDTAASPYLYDPKIYKLAGEIVGFHKILFGTDFPLLPASRYKAELDKVGLSKKEIKMITDQNARRLLGLTEKGGGIG